MSEIEDIITQAARSAGLAADVMLRIADIESSMNPAARTPSGKYLGLFQLSQDEFIKYGGGDIFDAADNARAAARKLKAESDQFRAKHGRAPGAFEIYMIHQQGWSGFHALQASPDSLAWVAIRKFYATDAVAKQAIAGNCPAAWGDGAALTARQFLDLWRARVEPPVWLAIARQEIGVMEAAGGADNPRVVAYYADAGHAEVRHDDVAWCAAFVGAILRRAGIEPSGSLMARSYLRWGADAGGPRAGCVAVLWRNSPDAAEGHVGFVTSWTSTTVTLLGGNQGDGVNEAQFPRTRVLGWRWPISVPAVIATPAHTEDDLTERLQKYVEAFAPLAPVLARAMGSPARGVVAAVIADAVVRSGKQQDGEDPADTLNRVGVAEGVSLLRMAEDALSAVGAIVAPVVEPAPTPAPVVTSPAPVVQPAPAPAPTATDAATPFDTLFGGALAGWKTYIVIILATLLNIAAGLGWAPMLLTPDVVAAGNTLLAGLGGAALVSKIERYAKLGAGLIKKA